MDVKIDAALDISAWVQRHMSIELPPVTTEMQRRPGRPNESSPSHNKQKAAPREATEQTLEQRQGRRFPRTFLALRFLMLTARL